MKLVYAPFAIIAAALGKRLGKVAFESVWSAVGDGDTPPLPTAGQVGLARVATASALEAATMAAVAAVVDQITARWFHHMFGAWPGKPPKPPESPESPELPSSLPPVSSPAA